MHARGVTLATDATGTPEGRFLNHFVGTFVGTQKGPIRKRASFQWLGEPAADGVEGRIQPRLRARTPRPKARPAALGPQIGRWLFPAFVIIRLPVSRSGYSGLPISQSTIAFARAGGA